MAASLSDGEGLREAFSYVLSGVDATFARIAREGDMCARRNAGLRTDQDQMHP
jgi:hypothetical protein